MSNDEIWISLLVLNVVGISQIRFLCILGAGIVAIATIGISPRRAYAAGSLASVPTNIDAKPFVMRPGVVVDPAKGAIYMMNPQGGIDAVAIVSGELLWTSKAAAKPLAICDDRLVAQAETARGGHLIPIVLLDLAQGRKLADVPIPVSDPLSPSIDDGRGFSSSVTAEPKGKGFLVSWEVASQRISGISHPTVVTRYSGAVSVDPETKKVATITATDALTRSTPSRDPQPRLTGSEGLLFSPVKADGAFGSLQVGPATTGQHAVLKRWSLETGEPLSDTDVGDEFVAYSIAADRTDIAVVRSEQSTGGGSHSTGFLWSIYAIASGMKKAEFRVPGSATPFFLRHSLLVRESAPYSRNLNGAWIQEPLQLIASDIHSGVERWKRGLRDTTYEGAPIPHP